MELTEIQKNELAYAHAKEWARYLAGINACTLVGCLLWIVLIDRSLTSAIVALVLMVTSIAARGIADSRCNRLYWKLHHAEVCR
jgi:hypothetical protein